MLLETFVLAELLKPQQYTPQPTQPIPIVETVKPKEKEKPKTYTVEAGDSLVKIAEKYKTPVKRLWAYNRQLRHQDKLDKGQVIKIPHESLKLRPRAFVKPKVVQVTTPHKQANRTPVRGSFGGNTYTPGNCTFFAKSRRPDIPNNWGNASSWLSNARSMGWPTGSTPRVGAIAWEYNHVSIVTSIRGGQVTVTEMNFKGLYVVSSRTKPSSHFQYIY